MKPSPSAAWLNEAFSTPQRTDTERRGRASTRRPVHIFGTNLIVDAVGDYEARCLHLLEHLRLEGLVRRWKLKPINLLELGGWDAVPTVLAELSVGGAEVVRVKARRYLTKEREEAYERERQFLEPLGFGYHVWTDRDVLSSQMSHTVGELARGRLYPAEKSRIDEIRDSAQQADELGQLLDKYGWDDVLSAAAHLAFYFDITKQIHEQTKIFRDHSPSRYVHLFARGNAASGWWESLSPAHV